MRQFDDARSRLAVEMKPSGRHVGNNGNRRLKPLFSASLPLLSVKQGIDISCGMNAGFVAMAWSGNTASATASVRFHPEVKGMHRERMYVVANATENVKAKARPTGTGTGTSIVCVVAE